MGLLEFDGVEWSFYPSPNGTVIRSVAVDQNNRIYTSGYREIGYWERDRVGKLVYQSLNHKAESKFSKNEEFWTTEIIGDKVYFHSFSSVFVYDNEEFRVIRINAMINSIHNLDGALCLNVAQRGLFLAEDTLLKPFLHQPEISNDLIRFSFYLEDSSLLIGTSSRGLFRYSENRVIPFLEEWNDY
ncbi:MAG: hypothetical protein KAT15_06035, partial [Bacteroidales bacterium]|nr:hypothetical protein [Bacteroidales bacterium]